MKAKTLTRTFLAMLLLAALFSCNKYTIEDKAVTGTITYVRTDFTILEVDTLTQQPVSASITMEGNGIITDMGELNMVSTFKFTFATLSGSDFVTTYTSASSASDSFSATGTSQMQQDGSLIVIENFSNGKGKFEEISGGGETVVVLVADQSAGTGEAAWTITY